LSSRVRSKEPVHDTSTGSHENAEPPPLVRAAVCALEQDFVGRRKFVTLDFASSGCGGGKRFEGRGGQHFRGRVGEVQGHDGGAVGLVEVEALDLVVAVDGDEVLLRGVLVNSHGCVGVGG
jgi:hypothetical protein